MEELETLFSSQVGETLTIGSTLLVVVTALLLGLLISLVYIGTHKREGYSPSFTITLIMLPAIISIVILLVGNSVARAFSLAGAFTLIRFRSAPGDPKDIAYVFFSVSVGLACGIGYLAYGALFAVILCLVMILLYKVKYATPKNSCMTLKITVPEDMNYQGLFDDLLTKYTDHWRFTKVKTSDFGSLFTVVFHISLKNGCDQKKFLDEIRSRNGNLDVSLSLRETESRVESM